MKKKYGSFINSGLNSRFDYSNLSFNTYVEHMRTIIEASREDLNSELREVIIDANSPFEWFPAKKCPNYDQTNLIQNGILLVHGLFDSPHTLLSLAEHFHSQNYLVRAILLPGHGTNPGDLIGVTFHEWLKAVRYGIESFSGQVENLFLAGFSTGGALLIHDILHHSTPSLKGLMLFAPALKLLTPIAILSNINKLLRTTTIRGMRWLTKSANHDYAKYLSFTLEPANQVNTLTHVIQKKLKEAVLDVPIFLVATEDDEMLSTRAMVQLIEKNPHLNSSMLLYGNSDQTFLDNRIQLVSSHFPEQRILNFSHMCLPVAPNHPHYGLNGDYHDFLHYEEGISKKPKTLNEEPFFGAVTHRNLRKHFIQRLTYNPDFNKMIKKMSDWPINLVKNGSLLNIK